MKKRLFIQAAALLAAGGGTALGLPVFAQTKPLVEVWKDPSCGCCGDWVSHMQASGFQVQVHDTGNAAVRNRLGVPEKMALATLRWWPDMRLRDMCPHARYTDCSRNARVLSAWRCLACRLARRVWMVRHTTGAKIRMTLCFWSQATSRAFTSLIPLKFLLNPERTHHERKINQSFVGPHRHAGQRVGHPCDLAWQRTHDQGGCQKRNACGCIRRDGRR